MPTKKTTLHALLVAIDLYHPQSGVSNLGGCVNDISHVKKFLAENYDSLDQSILVLKNQEATRENIINQFQKHLIKKAKAGDTVIFCYAGHGSYARSAKPFKKYDPQGQDETLVCYDSRMPGKYDLTDKEIAVLLSRIKDGVHTVVVADSCHSASVTRSAGEEDKSEIDGSFKFPNKRFLASRKGEEERSMDSYLLSDDNFYGKMWSDTGDVKIPESKHILFSACNRKEVAAETHAGRGLFSTNFWNVLAENKDISYADLFAKVRNAVNSERKEQTPTMSVLGGFNPNRLFLMSEEMPNKKRHLVEQKKNQWRMAYGAIHGVPTDAKDMEQIQIGIYPDVTDANSDKLLFQVGLKQVLLKECVLKDSLNGTKGLGDLEAGKMYRAEIQNLPNALLIDVDGKRRFVKKWEKIYEEKPSAFLNFQKKAEHAKYCLKIEKDRLLVENNHTKTLIHGAEGVDEVSVAYIVKILETIEEWERLAAVNNEKTKFDKDALEVIFIDESDEDKPIEIKEDNIILDFPKAGEDRDEDGDLMANYYTIKAKNNTKKKLYVSLVHLSGEYGVDVHFDCKEIPAGSKDFTILDNTHGLVIPDKAMNEITDVFKVLISTEVFDDYQFQSEGFELGKIIKPTREAAKRSALKRKNKSESDWYARTLTVSSIRKQKKIGSRSADFSENGIVFHPHSSFKADIAFAPMQRTTRSVTPISKLGQIFNGGGFELLSLQGENTRSIQDNSIIELSGIENKAALKKDPLKISIKQKLEKNENLIPITFDGEFIIPFGESHKEADGSTTIQISEIPKTGPSPVSSPKRSLGKAVWFCLLKAVGETERAFKLRYVSFDENGKAKRNTGLTAAKIQKKKKILLVVHGILGDTKPMLKNFQFLLTEGRYDMILTYDYENLNEPIEKTAKILNKKLEEVGIGEKDGKQFDILAHSMGGLVSRYLIEYLRKGDDMVDNLYMFGTPNGGSPFGEIPAYRDMITKFLTIALNFSKPWLGPVSGYLGGLNKVLIGSKMLTVTLAQMSATSPFTKKLWESAVKGHTNYTIVAGDTSLYSSTTDGRIGRFMDQTVVKVGQYASLKEPNDVAVKVDQIKAIPDLIGTKEIDVCCHHMNYFEDERSMKVLKEIVGGQI